MSETKPSIASVIHDLRFSGDPTEEIWAHMIEARIEELESELASCRECRAKLDCLSRGAVPVRDDGAERMAGLSFGAALDLAQEGLDRWREKPHNAKWWRRIDGTPIPNDLLVNIAEVIAAALQPKDTAK